MYFMCKHTEDTHTKGNTEETSPQNGCFCITLFGCTHAYLCRHIRAPAAATGEDVQTHVRRCTCSAPCKVLAKWYYWHWKTLESTVRCTQLKHFPLSKRAETRYAGPQASEALRGSWRVQEVAMFALSTLPLCLPLSCSPGGFQAARIPHKRWVISIRFKKGLCL